MYITESLGHSLQSSLHSATPNLDLTVVKMILLGLLLKGKVKGSLWGRLQDFRSSLPTSDQPEEKNYAWSPIRKIR